MTHLFLTGYVTVFTALKFMANDGVHFECRHPETASTTAATRSRTWSLTGKPPLLGFRRPPILTR